MPFQTAVGVMPAPAVAGDFCDTNPRWTYDAGPGGLVAGPNGVTVGAFAWAVSPLDANNAPAVVNNFGSGLVAGFVHREQQALTTAYLQEVTLIVPTGFPVTLFTGGGFWVKNSGSTEALPGMKAYASFANGAVSFAATGSPTTSASGTASSIAAETSSFTGSISDNLMTVSAVSSGTIYAGTTISGTNVSTGNQVQAQLTPLLSGESLGGIGRYYVSIPDQSVAAGTAISGTYGLLTVGGTVTGTFAVGGILSGTDVVSGTILTASVSGTGGAGTYVVNNDTVVASTTISQTGNVETKWYCMSAGPSGALVKISDKALG